MTAQQTNQQPTRPEQPSESSMLMESGEIVVIGHGDRERVLEILEEIHGTKTATRAAALWDWKFLHNPFVQSGRQMMIGFRQDGKLMGCVLSLPCQLKVENKDCSAGWPVDHMMSRKVKSKALMTNSLKMLGILIQNYDICPGQPVVGLEKMWARSVKLKNVVVGNYFFFHTVLRIDGLLRTRFKLPPLLAGLGQCLWGGFELLRRSLGRPAADTRLEFNQVDQVPAEIDDLWREVSPGIPRAVVRNRQYLQWRFMEIPEKSRYTFLVARRMGKVVGYIVLSLERSYDLNKALLVDILGDVRDGALWNGLLAEAIRWSHEHEADILTCVEFTLPELKGLLSRHFFAKSKRFFPLISCSWLPEHRTPGSFDSSRWYLSYADSDCEIG